jgi:solute:Na+ symporter, SSS family
MSLQVSIDSFDVLIIIAYLVAIVALGCWAGLRERRQSNGEGYFLAGRSLRWPVIGLALFSTNISTLELVSLAQEGYRSGLVYGNLELLAPVTLVLLAILFVPFYIRSGVSTLPDFLEKRYGRDSRRLLVILSIASAIFIHLGFALFTGGKVIEGLFGVNLVLGMTIVLGLTGLYTIVGGLKAVALTEAVQAIVLITGSTIIMVAAMIKVGGWSGLASALASEPERLTLLRSTDVEPEMAWQAVFLGYPIIGIWYWCTDQTIVQRALGAKDEQHAQVGAIFTGFIKILSMFIFILPGVACYALVKQGQIQPLTDTAQTLPFLISNLLPRGVQGIVVAALLAALMSTVAGALNSIATLFCYDIYREWRPHASERQMVKAGRLVTLIAMLLAIAWAPMIDNFSSILEGNTAMICYLAPSITTVFLWGVLWKRASKKAAFITLCGGSCLGFIVFVLDRYKEYTGWNISFMMGSFYLFVVCSTILVLVSWICPHVHSAESRSLVWEHPLDMLRQPGWKGLLNYKFLSLLLLLSVAAVYLILG